MPATEDELADLEERVNLRLAAELAAIRTEIAETRGELRAEIANTRGELRAEIADKLRAQTWAMVTTMISLTGIVFTLTRFT
jgi:hypothetical protein